MVRRFGVANTARIPRLRRREICDRSGCSVRISALDVEFARFLDTARGSLNECRSHIGDARDRNYIDEVERSALDSLASRAVGAVAGLQRHPQSRKRKRS